MTRKNFYITTSIAYANAYPHIGFALEVVQADVIARYRRLLGQKVFFLTGTDEYGQKISRAAEQVRKNPKEFTDEISAEYKSLTKTLNLSNSDFIRTSDQGRHWPVVKDVWLKLKERGDVYKKKYQGFYCVGCEAFITKKDLIGGKCKIHQKEPEVVAEENYFFKLSKYSKKIEEIIKKDKVRIIPTERKKEMLNFISQGLADVSFSRLRKNLKWGIAVPDDDSQTIYVWADALLNYISALNYPKGKNFKKYWPADIHFLGKDILRFHATIWLGMLLSLGLELPKNIFVHGFITSDGQKMSKSLGNVVGPFELVKKYGTDAVRYFLLREIPAAQDGDFTYEKFKERYNADLAAGLGNLVSRVTNMALKVRIEKKKRKIKNAAVEKNIKETEKKWKQNLEQFKFSEALASVWDLIRFCDQYIEKESPWKESKNQIFVIGDLLIALANIARFVCPFLPETSQKILDLLGIKSAKETVFKIQKGQSLFPRVIS